ncbi:MAG TPA: acyl-CoA-binding protein [Flavobacteriaceae bacterium]|jgi:acyl-CoA-binding protein|nr:acyl-CoA-binding protein [Flavobacteriaceae bacterium]
MENDTLHQEFLEAVKRINNHIEPFPADILLRLYAFYKRATHNTDYPSSKTALINAFKANALFQTRNMSAEDAKRAYIDTVNNYFLYKK